MGVIVIGGGIGGLAAAVALCRIGAEVRVFERAPEVKEVGAGITLWTNAVKVLRALGVGPAVEAHATPLTRSELRRWDGKLLTGFDLGPVAGRLGAPTVGTHRADLHRALADALGPDRLTLGAGCEGFAEDAGGVAVRFAGGRQERADLLIGADGIRSAVRRKLRGAEPVRYAGYTAWRGVGRVDRPEVPVGVTGLAVGRGSQAGYLPIGDGRLYWFATANVPEGQADPPGRAKAGLLDRFRDWYPPIPAMIEATDEAAILRNDIVDRPPVRPWGAGRVTLLGDAAHPTTPNLGQGACMAIEDALVLARCVATAGPVPSALRQYEQQRYARTEAVTRTSWRLGKALALEGRLACGVRDAALKAFGGLTLRQTEKLIGAEV